MAMPADSEIVAAMDANEAGRELADLIEAVYGRCGRGDLTFRRHEPIGAEDWNDLLKARRNDPPLPASSPEPRVDDTLWRRGFQRWCRSAPIVWVPAKCHTIFLTGEPGDESCWPAPPLPSWRPYFRSRDLRSNQRPNQPGSRDTRRDERRVDRPPNWYSRAPYRWPR